eukprot:749237-Pelagomonas_calceolata.AAC.1
MTPGMASQSPRCLFWSNDHVQVAHFDVHGQRDSLESDLMMFNGFLPPDVKVLDIRYAEPASAMLSQVRVSVVQPCQICCAILAASAMQSQVRVSVVQLCQICCAILAASAMLGRVRNSAVQLMPNQLCCAILDINSAGPGVLKLLWLGKFFSSQTKPVVVNCWTNTRPGHYPPLLGPLCSDEIRRTGENTEALLSQAVLGKKGAGMLHGAVW